MQFAVNSFPEFDIEKCEQLFVLSFAAVLLGKGGGFSWS